MASSTHYSSGLKLAITVALVFSFAVLISTTVGVEFSGHKTEGLEERGKLVGSKPPACVDKCMNCRPCMATLVIPPHQNNHLKKSPYDEDDTYYLLTWRCKCGDKLFQP